MLKKRTILLCSALLLSLNLLIVPMAIGAGENEIVLEKLFTSMTPIFMSGHSGDPNWIEGFSITGDINFGVSTIGTLTATISLVNPPMSLTERYDFGLIKMVNTLTGLGTFETTGQALIMASSTSTTSGDVTFSWSGSISNGTGTLSGLVGLVAGTGEGNNFTGTGSGKEILLFRFGY